MDKYNCPNPHVTTIVQLLRLTYPDIDFGSGKFKFKIVDSTYPNSDITQFNDDDFDNGITELLNNPPKW